MDTFEYDALQNKLRKKLHRTSGRYMSAAKEEIYREGIRAAMSILSSHQKHVTSAKWVFAGYGSASCTKCHTKIPNNSPLPQFCPVCGALMQNDELLHPS